MLDASDRATALQSILLSGLPAELRDQLLGQAAIRSSGRGSTVILQDEPAHSIFVVLDGWVKLYRLLQSGTEAVVEIFTKGQSFGEAVAFRGDLYPVTAEAVTDCRLLQIRAASVLEMMKSHPEVFTAILASTFLHLHALVGQIEQLKAQTGAQRVAEFLLDLSPVEDGACAVTLPYDKVLIAGRLGMKPESLSRAFARLRATGVHVQQNRAVIADIARLRAYIEEDRAQAWSRAH
ncbi:MAG: Crp/Fnr family transcriptional regulator [Paracoccaceae bacterium]|nr:Crp/Fnr family transcriptional regulator [Paracoccaceae bacterium]